MAFAYKTLVLLKNPISFETLVSIQKTCFYSKTCHVTAWSYLCETIKCSFFSLLSIFFDQNTSILIKGVAVSLFDFSGGVFKQYFVLLHEPQLYFTSSLKTVKLLPWY